LGSGWQIANLAGYLEFQTDILQKEIVLARQRKMVIRDGRLSRMSGLDGRIGG